MVAASAREGTSRAFTDYQSPAFGRIARSRTRAHLHNLTTPPRLELTQWLVPLLRGKRSLDCWTSRVRAAASTEYIRFARHISVRQQVSSRLVLARLHLAVISQTGYGRRHV
jgi:hypothetical protein